MIRRSSRQSRPSGVSRRGNDDINGEDDDDWAVISGTSSSTFHATPLPSDNDDELISIDLEDGNDNDDSLVSVDDDTTSDDSTLYSADDDENVPPESAEAHQNAAGNVIVTRNRRNHVHQCPSYLHHRHETFRYRYAPRAQLLPQEPVEPEPPPPAEQLANPLFNDDDADDFTVLMDAFHYVAVPAVVHAMPLTLFILSCIFMLSTLDQWPATSVMIFISAGVGASKALCSFITRTDFRVASGFLLNDPIEKQIIQLLAVCLAIPLLVWIPVVWIFEHFGSLFFLTAKCFLLSFVALFTLDIPLSLNRMAVDNPVFGEILAFELVAHLLPTAYIAAPFLLMDLLAALIIPPEWQSVQLWVAVHLVAASWIAMIVVGIVKYPEITVQRRHGIPGYIFMTQVTTVQYLLAVVIVTFLWLLQVLFMGGILSLGPTLLESIVSAVGPPKQWLYHHPYPITFVLCSLISVTVCLFRIINLTLYLIGYEDQIENRQHL